MKKMRKFVSVFCLILLVMNISGCVQETPSYVEMTADEAIFEDKFYYGQLSEEEQLAYREIYQGLMAQEEQFNIHKIDGEIANNILHNIIYDFAEIFWADGSATATTYEETIFVEGHTVMEVNYTYSEEEREQKESEIITAAEEIVNSVPSEYSEYEKIKYIYEYLVNNVDYVEGVPDDQNVYSALVGKQTVCAGYAKANQYLLNKLGIYCAYVTGTATMEESTEAHAWNIVRCNEKFYYVDVTWADPLFMEGQIQMSDMIYDYLCCSENILTKTHTLDAGYDYPVCDSEDLDYYRMNNMYYETVQKQQLLNKMKASINAKEEYTTFKFADSELYEEGKQMLMDGLLNSAAEYLCEKYNLWEVEYFYNEYANVNRFIVYWQYE